MDGYLVTALNDIHAAICVAGNAVSELKERVKCNCSFYDTLTGYQNAIKRAYKSYDVIAKALKK